MKDWLLLTLKRTHSFRKTSWYSYRLPNEAWLKPYTDNELERLAKSGVKNLVIVTPAFVTDCL